MIYHKSDIHTSFYYIEKSMSIKEKIAHELHKSARKFFPRRRVKILHIGDLLQADLVEMIPYAKVNNGYKYMLTLIDCFSKKAFAAALKDKTAKHVRATMETILPKGVKHLQTDDGKEFFNKDLKELMKKRKIVHYHTYSHLKASIVERFNRTLKNWMWEMFSSQGSYRWIDNLPKLINKYNNKVHRSIGMKPNDVSINNSNVVLSRLMPKRNQKSKPKFKVGDFVRISKHKHVFVKGYQPSWTTEVFTIHEVKGTTPVTYILKDENKQIIAGGFYEQELIKTKFKDVFLVEKVLKQKNGKSYVKWVGFPTSANSWIDNKDLV